MAGWQFSGSPFLMLALSLLFPAFLEHHFKAYVFHVFTVSSPSISTSPSLFPLFLTCITENHVETKSRSVGQINSLCPLC